jgi:hypothetical protein
MLKIAHFALVIRAVDLLGRISLYLSARKKWPVFPAPQSGPTQSRIHPHRELSTDAHEQTVTKVSVQRKIVLLL